MPDPVGRELTRGGRGCGAGCPRWAQADPGGRGERIPADFAFPKSKRCYIGAGNGVCLPLCIRGKPSFWLTDNSYLTIWFVEE